MTAGPTQEQAPELPYEDGGLDLLGIYLQQIGKIPLLKGQAEETELSKAIEVGLYADNLLNDEAEDSRLRFKELIAGRYYGDEGACVADLSEIANEGRVSRERFIEANLRLVVPLAKVHKSPYMSMLDLIDAGNLGLVRAVDKFDHTKGYKFSTYATQWIKNFIFKARTGSPEIGGDDMIRLPRLCREAVYGLYRDSREFVREFQDMHDRPPTDAELAAGIGMDLAEINEIRQLERSIISTDQKTGPSDGAADTELSYFIADSGPSVHELAERNLVITGVRKCLAVLDRDEREIVSRVLGLYGNKEKLAIIARDLGVSRYKIKDIYSRALDQLREQILTSGLTELVSDQFNVIESDGIADGAA